MAFIVNTKKIEKEKIQTNSNSDLALQKFIKEYLFSLSNSQLFSCLSNFILRDGMDDSYCFQKTDEHLSLMKKQMNFSSLINEKLNTNVKNQIEKFIKPKNEEFSEIRKEYFKLVMNIYQSLMQSIEIPKIFDKNLEYLLLARVYVSVAEFAMKSNDFSISLQLLQKGIELNTSYQFYGGQTLEQIIESAPPQNKRKKLELESKAFELSLLIAEYDENNILYPIDIANIIKEFLGLSIKAETIKSTWNIYISAEVQKNNNVKREDIAKEEAELFSQKIIDVLRKDFL